MITPQFAITQDDEYLYIRIKVSGMRFNAPGLELVVDGNLLVFYLSPYYLRLRFSHNLVEDESLNLIEYDSKDEYIKCKILKSEKGQVFEDLDLPTKLLATKNEKLSKGPLIQEIGGGSDSIEAISKEGELLDWEVKQELHSESAFSDKYGFDSQYSGYISVSVANGNDINELDDPEHTDKEIRVKERLHKENLKFDAEYYAAEYLTSKYGDAEELEINGIKSLLQYTPPLISFILNHRSESVNVNDQPSLIPVEFTEKEQQQMQDNIPSKVHLITDVKTAYLTLLSLLYSYCFEQVENEGMHTTESPWTIGKLTPQLSALDQQILLSESVGKFSNIKAIIITAIRRSLSYPLHRNYELCIKVWRNTLQLLKAGKKMVVRALLDIHEIFRYHDVYYVYNKILLDDLCSWFISQGNETIVNSLAAQAEKELREVNKSQIEFECISGVDEDTGEIQMENITIEEIEYLVDQEKME